jgi:hypothetical protein
VAFNLALLVRNVRRMLWVRDAKGREFFFKQQMCVPGPATSAGCTPSSRGTRPSPTSSA